MLSSKSNLKFNYISKQVKPKSLKLVEEKIVIPAVGGGVESRKRSDESCRWGLLLWDWNWVGSIP